MLSKVARGDDNLPPRKKAKYNLGYAAGKEKSYVRDIFFLLVTFIIILKTQGPPTTISS